MRRRYVVSTLAIVMSGIVLLAAVMVWASGRGIVEESVQRIQLNADRVAAELHDRLLAGERLTAESLAAEVPVDRQVVVQLDDGTRMSAGAPVGRTAYQASAVIPGFGVVTVLERPDRIDASRFASAASIIGLALLVSLASVVVAFREARRLTAPLEDLAETARRLGEGDSRPPSARYGIPELDELAEALDAGAERINTLVADERLLTVDASHQLRTPLTALSMRLEEILRAEDPVVVREEAVAALEQVERLSGVVDDMLVHRTSWQPPDVRLPVAEVVRQQLDEWQPAFSAAGRRVVFVDSADLLMGVPRGAVGQVLSSLLENSLQHGAGTTTVRGRRLDGAVCVEVEDEGPGVPVDLVARVFERQVSGAGGTGMGLAMARSTAESVGGRLELVSRSPARFALFLSSSRDSGQEAVTPAVTGTLGNTHLR